MSELLRVHSTLVLLLDLAIHSEDLITVVVRESDEFLGCDCFLLCLSHESAFLKAFR